MLQVHYHLVCDTRSCPNHNPSANGLFNNLDRLLIKMKEEGWIFDGALVRCNLCTKKKD